MKPQEILAPAPVGMEKSSEVDVRADAGASGPVVSSSGQRPRRSTSTSRFGSSRRESHDATAFYERFTPPELSTDQEVCPPKQVDVLYHADARDMHMVADNSVALMVTSPPYFAGKAYEESLGENGVPASYFEYLTLLTDVFDECKRVLEPGGRIAVNVANLGRRPYRSLAADIVRIFEDLGLLMRGEVVWWKGKAAGGSCAWGTFQRPNNPVLRDVTERILIASKGRFDRALGQKERSDNGRPSVATITRDEFLEATTDLWEMPPESATRVGHPAPFPVELPKRLIDLYTYKDDLILDPFMGSGTTAVAAVRTGRHFIGFDTDASYIERALDRINKERQYLPQENENPQESPQESLQESPQESPQENEGLSLQVHLPAGGRGNKNPDFQEAVREGRQAKEVAGILLSQCGFNDIRSDVRMPGAGIEVSFLARDHTETEWAFDLYGGFVTGAGGLRRTENVWKALGKAAVLHSTKDAPPLVLLTTDTPPKGSEGLTALRKLTGPGKPIFDVVELLDPAAHKHLSDYASNQAPLLLQLPGSSEW